MKRIRLNKKVATGLTIAAVGGGWLGGAVLGTPSLSSASTVSSVTSAPTTNTGTSPQNSGHDHRGPRIAGDLLSAAATDLNTTVASIQSELASGKSLATIAGEHNVSAATLISELTATATTNINNAAKAGTITSTQQSNALAHLNEMITNFVNNTHVGGPGGGANGGPGGRAGGQRIAGDLLSAAATDLNTTVASIQSELASGKSLATIAGEHNVSAATLISELTATATTNINNAAKAGTITSTQQSNALAHLNEMITNFVNNTHVGGPGGGANGGFPTTPPSSSSAGSAI
ncbi:MAG: hypothetical protein M0019_04855 [Actinomycetota bacterium]|nr:hypothetical protein [Actinomycetota bacterium]